MIGSDLDFQVRMAAFRFLEEQTQGHGRVLPRRILEYGFILESKRIPLISPQGIFRPAILPDLPLSITTVPIIEGRPRPYEDEIESSGLIRYRYRGTDARHRDNASLRLAMQQKVPLIYNYGHVPGRYEPIWPVYVVGDDPTTLSFAISVDERRQAYPQADPAIFDVAESRRRYITVETQRRLHQESFRQRVLKAYLEQCAICLLRHDELLEAAHILPDGHPKGEPIVPNGLSLCKLHHAAFDRNIIGVNPDFRVEVREDILREEDGPMLLHGLQGFQNRELHVPRPIRLQPNRDFLAERYELSRKAS